MPYDPRISDELHYVPIPPAALVIDMRKVGAKDDVLETLKTEIENLAEEMDMQHVHSWRYLTNFLEFRRYPPLNTDEAQRVRTKEDKIRQQRRALIGTPDKGRQNMAPGEHHRDPDIDISFFDELPNDNFKRNIDEASQLIDMIRNERIEATGDLGTTGRIEQNTLNSKVEVIFLTDEEESDTLSSAAAYAAHLKYKYRPFVEKMGKSVLDTTIIVLNHTNQSTPPRQLINKLSWRQPHANNGTYDEWEHIDALILCEQYGHNAVRIHQSIQPYIAELLLYALLIGGPLDVRPPAPDYSQLYLPSPEMKVKETHSLPSKTYLVGLAAIEHSTHWGRRLLNFGLTTDALEVLLAPLNDEQRKTARTVDIWLSDWRSLVESTVPDQIAADAPEMQAFSHSAEVASSAEQFFTSSKLTFDNSKETAEAVKRYVSEVQQTYTITLDERQTKRQALQKATGQENVVLSPTLQDALDSIPQVQQQLSIHQEDDVETPLLRAQHKAERVLSEPGFFNGARAAIPRAKLQLNELGRAIGAFQNKHQSTIPNLQESRESLSQLRDKSLKGLQDHSKRFPLLAGLLGRKTLLSWLTLIADIILTGFVVVVLLAWLHYLGLLLLPGLIGVLDTSLFGLEIYGILTLIVTVLAIVIFVIAIAGRLLDKNRSALRVEIHFVAALIAFGVIGLIVSLSVALYTIDPAGSLSWISWLPLWSTILFVIGLVIIIVEIIYYFLWRNRLIQERRRIIDAVRQHQQETAQLVRHHIADTLALELLRRAELTDGKKTPTPGPYYQRVNELQEHLDKINEQTNGEYHLARRRLESSSHEQTENASAKTPQLKIREELLDVPSLSVGSKRLTTSVKKPRQEMQELAELIVRIMGAEAPIAIEQEFEERLLENQQSSEDLIQVPKEQHDAEILLSATVALALRLSLFIPKVDTVSPLKDRFKEIDYRITDQLPSFIPLFNSMLDRLGETMENSGNGSNPNSGSDNKQSGITLAIHALALWSQMLWEYKDEELDKLLTSKGVLSKLQQKGYDPQTVKAMLYTRTVVSGISSKSQTGELYMLKFPTLQGNRFFQDMQLEPHYMDIPDTERLILLFIGQYVAPPYYIVEESGIEDDLAANGQNGQPKPDDVKEP